jgi:hypothetical protein
MELFLSCSRSALAKEFKRGSRNLWFDGRDGFVEFRDAIENA